jgi:archaellum component FlaC
MIQEAESAVGRNAVENLEHVKVKLCGLHAEYVRRSRQYDAMHERMQRIEEEIPRKKQSLHTFSTALRMFEEQIDQLERYALISWG